MSEINPQSVQQLGISRGSQHTPHLFAIRAVEAELKPFG